MGRDGRGVDPQPTLERDAVAEVQLVGEHVDVESGLRMQVDVAPPLRGHVDPPRRADSRAPP